MNKDVMTEHVQSPFKCAQYDFESKSHNDLKNHIGHTHRDLEDIEMVCDPELKDKSLELVETAEDREELLLPLANSTIKMEEAVTKSESI